MANNSKKDIINHKKKLFVKDEKVLLDPEARSLADFEWSPNLKLLAYSGPYINKIENLNTLINLEHLRLIGGRISKIENLENLQSLKFLDLSANNISEIEGLENLKNLEILRFGNTFELTGGNPIKEIKGLENLKILKELRFIQNEIIAISGLE
ncbi:MAG: leucine-rich repeat domain-containing protein [Candidatus Odinarchaeota archaeon]